MFRFCADYSAPKSTEKTHYVGGATSTSPEGPYIAETVSIACQTSGGGRAIDPAGFQDTDGEIFSLQS